MPIAKHLRLRSRQAPALVRRSLRHPVWAVDNARILYRRRLERARDFDLKAHVEAISDEKTAVMAVLGVPVQDYDAASARMWMPDRNADEPMALWDARVTLQSLVGVLVRLTAPGQMVETGVANGYTTAVILRAMSENGFGHLTSIDLPALEHEGRAAIGARVPAELRDRWTLHLGPSRMLLPRICQAVAPLDLFLHDADHTYASQLEEYRTVWPHIKAGGVLVSDDVQNPAFLEFAAEVGATPYLIAAAGENTAVGLMRK